LEIAFLGKSEYHIHVVVEYFLFYTKNRNKLLIYYLYKRKTGDFYEKEKEG